METKAIVQRPLERRVRRQMLHRKQMPVRLTRKGWEYETLERKVRVMAIAEKYAMVRLPRATPFVVPVDELFDLPSNARNQRQP